MSISNMINSNKFTEIDDIYDEFDDDDFKDEIFISNNSFNSNMRRKRTFNYFSMILTLILTLFIVFLFSNKCYNYIDKAVSDRVTLFNEEGTPNWLLIFLQFLVIFCIVKIICKY